MADLERSVQRRQGWVRALRSKVAPQVKTKMVRNWYANVNLNQWVKMGVNSHVTQT